MQALTPAASVRRALRSVGFPLEIIEKDGSFAQRKPMRGRARETLAARDPAPDPA